MQLSKYNSIAETLKMRILSGAYTAQLPPVRTLCNEFQVSSRTLTKAFRELKDTGFIKPGARGTEIAAEFNPVKAQKLVAVVFNGMPPATPLGQDLCFGALCNYINSIGAQVLVLGTSPSKQIEWISTLNDTRVAGFIFLYSSITPDAIAMLNERHIPYVACNWQPEEHHCLWVDFDWESTASQLVEQLIGHGIRRIAIAEHSTNPEARKMTYDVWSKVVQKCGIFDYGEAGEKCENWLSGKEEPPEAIIFIHLDREAELRERYARVGKTFHAVKYGVFDRPDCYGYVGRDWTKLAASAWEMLAAQWEHTLPATVRCKLLKPAIRIMFWMSNQ